MIRSPAVLVAIGIHWEGQRQVLAVELANRKGRSSWKDFFIRLKERVLGGVESVVCDDHAGLKKARGVLAKADWQRGDMHLSEGRSCASS